MALKRPGGKQGGMLSLHIKTKEDLYASYLPFLKNGGLFIRTEKTYRLGAEVFMLLTLLEGERMPVAGKVVWINPKGAQGNRPAGIGVHFNEVDNGNTRKKIETQLAGMMQSNKQTYTM
ncbi:MAG: pilus assembly protein PilZ [Gammaproteobacteria bacterium]|nr:pilus assembly protein PilZ [Gammaproteobacteria bacterium]